MACPNGPGPYYRLTARHAGQDIAVFVEADTLRSLEPSSEELVFLLDVSRRHTLHFLCPVGELLTLITKQ